MRISRILAIATGLEMVGLAAFLAGFAAFGSRNDKYDAINNFAPIWLTIAVIGAILGWFALGRRPARVVMAIAALAAILVFGIPILLELGAALAQGMVRTPPEKTELRVVTFNASAASYSPAKSAQILLAADPDVILVQEPVRFMESQPLLKNRYPHLVQCGQISQCELAIWSKRPIRKWGRKAKRVDQGLDDVEFLWAETAAADGRAVTVATTHYAWPIQPAQKGQRAHVVRYAHALPTESLILSGDFNLAPWTYALRGQDRNLAPLTRRTRALFTWPAYVPRFFAPAWFPVLPIDHLYAGPAWTTVSVERLPKAASDHYPVMVTLAR